MQKKIVFLSSLAILFFLGFLVLREPIMAQTGPYLGLEYGEYTGLGSDDVRTVVARIINVALGLLGIIFLVLTVYAGFRLMTAGGDEKGIEDAKKILFAGIIGLMLILSAFAISKFVFASLYAATTGANQAQIPDALK